MAQEKRSVSQILRRFRDFRYFLVLEGVGVGIAAGLVTVLFRITLERADTLRQTVGGYMARNPWLLPVWFLLLLGAAGLVTLLLKWEPLIGGSGIPQVEGEMQGELSQTWWKVLTAKFVGGYCVSVLGCRWDGKDRLSSWELWQEKACPGWLVGTGPRKKC